MELDMQLPPGKTCNDCTHYQRCLALIGAHNVEGSTSCDWSPSRFQERKDKPNALLPDKFNKR